MAPHPTEKENAENNKDATEIRCSTPINGDNNITSNGNNTSNPSINTEVGAKRRKPLKTNKVTQQVQVIYDTFSCQSSIHYLIYMVLKKF